MNVSASGLSMAKEAFLDHTVVAEKPKVSLLLFLQIKQLQQLERETH